MLVWLRGQDSNLRPLGYEPNELPLLHPAPLNRIPSTAAFRPDVRKAIPREWDLPRPGVNLPNQ